MIGESQSTSDELLHAQQATKAPAMASQTPTQELERTEIQKNSVVVVCLIQLCTFVEKFLLICV
jgi:hypothetical protein